VTIVAFHDASVMARLPNTLTLGAWNPSPGSSSVSSRVGAWLFVFIVPVDERSALVGTIVVAVIAAGVFVALARLLTRWTVRA
jgi:hypothetical protein